MLIWLRWANRLRYPGTPRSHPSHHPSRAFRPRAGAVNVYRTEDVLRSSRPSAVKEYLHLTSAVTTVNFHPECEMLTFASKYVKRAMRVAHVSARQVFSNWPTSKTPLNYVQCASFSPKAGYMAIGTDQGKARTHAPPPSP